MAETSEIVATSTGVGAFLGALLAAWKWRGTGDKQPEKGNDTMAVQIAELTRRADGVDKRLDDVFELLTASAKSLGECRENIREALTRLEERRK